MIEKVSKVGETAKFEVPEFLSGALELLLRAHSYAQSVDRNPWDFGVEIETLRQLGLTNSDFRLLICLDLVEHARETTLRSERGRRFDACGDLTFSRRSCFVLTPLGVRVATRTLAEQDVPVRHVRNDGIRTSRILRPTWDADRHRLSVGKFVVKEFKLPAANQETILTTFEEDGWPPRIDDPLPPAHDIDPKRRLHDAIKNLNRNQRRRLVRFMGDGTGQGIRWEMVAKGTDHERADELVTLL